MLARTVTCCLVLFFAVTPVESQYSSATRRDSDLIPPDTVITMSENGITVRIDANGVVTVEGQTFDFDLGRIKLKISEEQWQALVRDFTRINYFSLRDRYLDRTDGCRATGRCSISLTTLTTSFSFKGRSKSIRQAPYGCFDYDGLPYPRELTNLVKRIEEVVDLKRR
jgi:hypothetical protein